MHKYLLVTMYKTGEVSITRCEILAEALSEYLERLGWPWSETYLTRVLEPTLEVFAVNDSAVLDLNQTQDIEN